MVGLTSKRLEKLGRMYDKEEYDRIQHLKLGDLVHFMISKYEKPTYEYLDDPYMQSAAYYWAWERLNEILTETKKVNDD